LDGRGIEIDAYGLLRVSLEEHIGKLPRTNSIRDMLRIKEKKSKEISRLREVLLAIQACRQIPWGNTLTRNWEHKANS
jgi:hypothetical protein